MFRLLLAATIACAFVEFAQGQGQGQSVRAKGSDQTSKDKESAALKKRLERRARRERRASNEYWKMRNRVEREGRDMTSEERLKTLAHMDRVDKLEQDGHKRLIDPRDRQDKKERKRRAEERQADKERERRSMDEINRSLDLGQ